MNKNVYECDLESLCEGASETDTHYFLKCPICSEEGYHKKKLYIKKDFSIGWCFHCETVFKPMKVEDPEDIDSLQVNDGFRIDAAKSFRLVKLDSEKLSIPEYLSREDTELLDKRNPYLKLIDYAGIKSVKYSLWIPYYINDELIYYQRRLKNPINGMKYYNPTISDKPLYIPPGMKVTGKIIIVEGVFDALASIFLHADKIREGYVPVALMGKTITPYQSWLLNSMAIIDEVIYQLDKTELSLKCHEKSGKQLNALFYQYVPSNGADPEELLRSNYPIEYIDL